MDEVKSMWMEMVVFRIDLMNKWMGWNGSDICEVDGAILLEQEALEVGWIR